MRGARARHLGVVVAGILGIAIAVPPPHAAGVTVTADRLVIDSVDDFVGGDVRTELTDADATFDFVSGAILPGGVWVDVRTADEIWRLKFIPPEGETLEVGHYPEAGFEPPITEDIRISTSSNACGSNIGSFTIQQLDRDVSGNPVAFAATFEQWCDNSFGPLVGAVRVNSDVPQALLSTPQADRAFGSVTTGETSGPRTFTVESLGDLPVYVDLVATFGDLDFPIDDDGCTGAVLDTGETCSFDVSFEPTETEDRFAFLLIFNDAPQDVRVLPMGGFGRFPTETAVHVEPETTYFNPGIKLIATVTPAPGHNAVECWYDGELVGTNIVDPGSTFCVLERELGTHTFVAEYQGSQTHGDSESSVLTFEVSSETQVELEASTTSVPAGVPVDFTVDVSTASDLLYPGGSVILRDVTTDEILASRPIDHGSSTHVLSASFTAGTHEVEAAYEGVDGVLDPSADTIALTVLPDSTAPTATAPKHVPASGGVMSPAGGLPVRLTWTGADNLSGVARFEVARQLDGGAWSSPWSVSGPSHTTHVSPGHDVRYRIRPIDFAGNVGAWRYGSTFRLKRYPDYSAKVDYVGTWRKDTGAPWFGGTAMKSKISGARARFTVTGRSFAWIGLFGPNRGRASIYVNGKLKDTVNLNRASQVGQVVAWAKTWSASKTRTIEIRVHGTAGHPWVDVDAFWVGS